MTEIQRYLAEEIAEDHADGLVSRREALRRLGLLGLSGAAAGSLLAAALVDEAKARTVRAAQARSTTERRAAESVAAAAPTREITFRGPQGRRLLGAWAAARRPRGGVLVIHENRGLNDSIRSIAGGSRRAATPPWRSTCCRRRAAPSRSATSSRRWPRSGRPLLEIRGGHEGRGDGASPPPAGQEGRRYRFLLRRRNGLATAGLEGGSPRSSYALLRSLPRERESRGREGRGARDLRGARLEGQRKPGYRPDGSFEGRPAPPDRDVPQRRSCVLQPDRVAA